MDEIVAHRIAANAYSLSDQELTALTQYLRENNARSVLEFGPGRSTECFLRAGCKV